MSIKRTIIMALAIVFTLLAVISAVITVLNIINDNTEMLFINFLAVICCGGSAIEKWFMLKDNIADRKDE